MRPRRVFTMQEFLAIKILLLSIVLKKQSLLLTTHRWNQLSTNICFVVSTRIKVPHSRFKSSDICAAKQTAACIALRKTLSRQVVLNWKPHTDLFSVRWKRSHFQPRSWTATSRIYYGWICQINHAKCLLLINLFFVTLLWTAKQKQIVVLALAQQEFPSNTLLTTTASGLKSASCRNSHRKCNKPLCRLKKNCCRHFNK